MTVKDEGGISILDGKQVAVCASGGPDCFIPHKGCPGAKLGRGQVRRRYPNGTFSNRAPTKGAAAATFLSPALEKKKKKKKKKKFRYFKRRPADRASAIVTAVAYGVNQGIPTITKRSNDVHFEKTGMRAAPTNLFSRTLQSPARTNL